MTSLGVAEGGFENRCGQPNWANRYFAFFDMDGVFEFPEGLTGFAADHPGFESGLIVGIYHCINFAKTDNIAIDNGIDSQ